MSRELKALNDLRNSGLVNDDVVCFTKKALEIRLDIIEKALKALEIIKNKVQEIKWLGFEYKNGTNIYSIEYRETPTKEECDLLEEVLK